MDDVTLRPVEERDLDQLRRFATDPYAFGEFEWNGFGDPHAVRRRWEEDGWLAEPGKDRKSRLVVARGDGEFAGIVSWGDIHASGVNQGGCLEMGIALLAEHRGQGVGTEAQRRLVDYLFATTRAHRLEAFTDADNLAEQRALEKVGFQREGVLRGAWYRMGRWRDTVIYGLLRTDRQDSPEG